MGEDRPTTPGFGAQGREHRGDRDGVLHPAREITVENARLLDRLCTEEFGIPSIVLMENAARSLLDACLRMLRGLDRDECWVVCGPGNNGGDGYALARLLLGAGVHTHVFATHSQLEPPIDARMNLKTLRAMEIEIRGVDMMAIPQTPVLIVDCVFGTGLTRAPEGVSLQAIERINESRALGSSVLSCDIPSGLNATTGDIFAESGCIRADRTVTFVAPKPGMARIDAQGFIGELEVGTIGAPIGLVERLCTLIDPSPDRGS